MSERDDADRLSRAWDDFVQQPGAPRERDDSVDPTIREVHASNLPQKPDPAFRAQLRKQLERQAQYRAGQQQGTTVQSSAAAAQPTTTVAPLPFAPASRGTRPIEILAIAALLALVAAAAFWALEFRPTDDEPTATIELAATSPDEIAATPSLTPDPTATDEPTATTTEEPSPTATQEPTATETATAEPSPTATTPPTPTATTIPVACIAVADSYDGLVGPIANPALVPDITYAPMADAATIADLDSAYDGLIGCLGETSQTQRRLDITASLKGAGMEPLDAFTVTQHIDRMIAGDGVVSDHRRIDAASAAALLSIGGEPTYLVFFAFDTSQGEWHVASLARLPVDAPTQEPVETGGNTGNNQGMDNGSNNSGNGSSGNDDGSDDNGDDDVGDDGSDDNGDDDIGGDDTSDDNGDDDLDDN